MRRRGIDIAANRSCHVSCLDLREYELIICVETYIEDEVRKYLQGVPVKIIVPERETGGITDPPRTTSAIDEPERERCAEQIERNMRVIANELMAKT